MTRTSPARNDRAGVVRDTLRKGEFRTFYASGKTGHEVRADGEGGLLSRGYYAITPDGHRHGPHFTRNAAVWKAKAWITRTGRYTR